MRPLAPLLIVLVAGCSDSTVPGATHPDSALPPDASTPSDSAIPPDATVSRDSASPIDLAAPPDLRAPDLSVGADLTTPASCGGRGGPMCPGGQFCDIPIDCGAADEGGTCQVKPQVCNKIFDPVCGCDGQAYGNDCMRQAAGVSLRDHGICGCPQQCGVGSYCAQCKGGPACLPKGAVC